MPQTALLITVAAVAMCIGSPVLATLTSRVDRRTVLAGSLTLYAIGHALCAFAPSLTVLIVVRTITLWAPQCSLRKRQQHLGSSSRRSAGGGDHCGLPRLVSRLGRWQPTVGWLGCALGWRQTFGLFAALRGRRDLGASRGAAGLHRHVTFARRVAAGGQHPALIAILVVTAVSASGQFTTFAYIARRLLRTRSTRHRIRCHWHWCCSASRV